MGGGNPGSPGPGLYVHVPFCRSKCDYCDFYSVPPTPERVTAYLAKLAADLPRSLLPQVRTVFLGGGNPTVLGGDGLARLLEILRESLAGTPIAEWTVETNPETMSADVRRCLRGIPNLRLSMGLQRLHDGDLTWLGRKSSVDQGFQALTDAFSVTDNVGIDLILGLPSRPFDPHPLQDVLTRFPLTHVSAYFLSLEEGTPLARRAEAGLIGDPADVGPEDLFLVADVLARQGFRHDEISNFSRPGRSCLHNLNYWLGGEYLGIGPAAVGTWNGIRTSQPACLEGWLAGEAPTRDTLSREDLFRERVMLELRLLERGLDLEALAGSFPSWAGLLTPPLEAFAKEGFLRLATAPRHAWLTRAGIPQCNPILTELFAVLP